MIIIIIIWQRTCSSVLLHQPERRG